MHRCRSDFYLFRKMPDRNATGKRGEDAAFHFLKREGYEILDRNFRVKGGELDIVARSSKGELVVVEVKTRSNNAFGYPESFVDEAKQQRIVHAAGIWQEKYAPESGIRFDIIAVEREAKTIRIRHIEDAFRP